MATRIPETIAEFNGYINTTDDYLQAPATPPTNATRLGLSAQNATDWNDKRTYWKDTLYPKYQDPMQSTSAVKGNVKIFMDGFHTFANPLLNIMAVSPAAIHDDEVVFNFKIGKHEPTHATVRIGEMVAPEVAAHGGGDIDIKCKVAGEAGRAHKPAGADSVQVAYMIQGNDNNNPMPPNPNPNPGNDLPSPDSTAFSNEISTRTMFTLHIGTDNKGKTLVVAIRWFNTKHPELAGSWSDIQAVIIG